MIASTRCVPDTVLRILHEFTHLILTLALWSGYYYYPYIADGETEELSTLLKCHCGAPVIWSHSTSFEIESMYVQITQPIGIQKDLLFTILFSKIVSKMPLFLKRGN